MSSHVEMTAGDDPVTDGADPEAARSDDARGPGDPAGARRAAQDGRKENPWVPAPGEWENCSPPPSVLLFRALVLKGAGPVEGTA